MKASKLSFMLKDAASIVWSDAGTNTAFSDARRDDATHAEIVGDAVASNHRQRQRQRTRLSAADDASRASRHRHRHTVTDAGVDVVDRLRRCQIL